MVYKPLLGENEATNGRGRSPRVLREERTNKKIAIILHSGEYEKVHHGLSIALASVTNGMECHMFVAYHALVRLTKSQINEVPPDVIFRRPLRKLIQQAKESGILRLYACGSTMGVLGISRDELIEEFDEVSGLSAFLDPAEGWKYTFFI